jgi:DNA-binding CsgD family transcriptional regulator
MIETWAVSADTGGPPIDHLLDCVYLKRTSRVIAFANPAYQQFYGGGAGSQGDGFLDQATMGVALKSDELLISSGRMVEFEHMCVGPGGLSFNVKTHKRWLTPNPRGISILGITRILQLVERPANSTAEKLTTLAHKYQSLDADDRALCCLMAAGHSQRTMAELLGCTTRTIENRRNRIMEELGANKPIEIVKLMVRLAEHGLISADF